jgi:hypothetical protein
MGALAGLVVFALRGYLYADALPNWWNTTAAAVAVVAAFVAQRRVQNIFAGLAAAALLTLHPTWRQQSLGNGLQLLSETLLPAVGAVVAVGWRLTFHPRFAWRMWPVVGVCLAGCIGLLLSGNVLANAVGLEHPDSGRQGAYALILGPTGLLAGALLALGLRSRSAETKPSMFNPPTAMIVAVAAAVGGVIFGHFLTRVVMTAQTEVHPEVIIATRQVPKLMLVPAGHPWQFAVDRLQGPWTFSTDVFTGTQVDAWAWPSFYLTLPLLAYAFWRTVRRGAIQWGRKDPPYAWLLSLATLAVPAMLAARPGSPEEQTPLLLLSLVVALGVFLPIDLLQGTIDRMVLRPPQEEKVAEAAGAKG